MGTDETKGAGESRLKPYMKPLPSTIGRYRLFDLLVAAVDWYDGLDCKFEPQWVQQARAIIAEAKGEGK